MWDVDQAIAGECHVPQDSGLKGAELPVIQDGIPDYNLQQSGSRFGRFARNGNLPLVTHVGVGGRV